MSRIGKQPIKIPDGVNVLINDKDISVTGPRGELKLKQPDYVTLKLEGQELAVSIPDEQKNNKIYKSYHGLIRSLLNNMVTGVTVGYKKELEMKGIGYRAQMQNDSLVLNVGFSHQVIFPKIDGIAIQVIENTNIIIEGIDKQRVGQIAANIRKVRPPEPYKGKGIKYKDEIIRRKSGKSGKGAKGAK